MSSNFDPKVTLTDDDFILFELTGISFDPLETSGEKIKELITKKIKEMKSIRSKRKNNKMLRESLECLEKWSRIVSNKQDSTNGYFEKLSQEHLRRVKNKFQESLKSSGLSSVLSWKIQSEAYRIGLQETTLREFCQEKDVEILEENLMDNLPQEPEHFLQIEDELRKVRNYLTQRFGEQSGRNINNAYEFIAYLEKKSDVPAASYETCSTEDLQKLLGKYSSDKLYAERTDDFSLIKNKLVLYLETYVFVNDGERKKYENYLKYVSNPDLRKEFECIADQLDENQRRNPRFANPIIQKMETILRKIDPQYNHSTALAVYNQRAKLKPFYCEAMGDFHDFQSDFYLALKDYRLDRAEKLLSEIEQTGSNRTDEIERMKDDLTTKKSSKIDSNCIDLNYEIDMHNSAIVLKWKALKNGPLNFVIVRRRGNRQPQNLEDGERLGKVERKDSIGHTSKSNLDFRFKDHSGLESGGAYRYSIFTVGYGSNSIIISSPAVSNQVRPWFEVSKLTLEQKDQVIALSWSSPRSLEEATISIYRSSDHINEILLKDKLPLRSTREFKDDQNIKLGTDYKYRVRIKYLTHGLTNGVVAEIIPSEKIQAFEIEVKKTSDQYYEVAWPKLQAGVRLRVVVDNIPQPELFSDQKNCKISLSPNAIHMVEVQPWSEAQWRSVNNVVKVNTFPVYAVDKENTQIIPITPRGNSHFFGRLKFKIKLTPLPFDQPELEGFVYFVQSKTIPSQPDPWVKLGKIDEAKEGVKMTVEDYKNYGGLIYYADRLDSSQFYLSVFAQYKIGGGQDYSEGQYAVLDYPNYDNGPNNSSSKVKLNQRIRNSKSSDLEEINLWFIGEAKSGKSSYLTVMLEELGESRNLNLSIRPVDNKSRDLQESRRKSIYEEHQPLTSSAELQMPAQTWLLQNVESKNDTEIASYCLNFYEDQIPEKKEEKSSDAVFLFYDLWASENRDKFLEVKSHAELVEIMQMESTKIEQLIKELINQTRERYSIRTPKKLDIPLAIVVSKWDRALEAAKTNPEFKNFISDASLTFRSDSMSNWSYFNQSEVKQPSKEILNLFNNGSTKLNGLAKLLHENFSNYCWFPISNFGSSPLKDNSLLYDIEPFGVLNPIVWNLGCFEVI